MKKYIKSIDEINKISESCRLLAQMMRELEPMVKIGTTPLDIDKFAYDWILSHGAQNAFLGYGGFPNTLCIGVNDMATHGVPTDRPFQDGDLVTIDSGLKFDGMYSDMARTYLIGDVEEEKKKFVNVVKSALDTAISRARPGGYIGDISFAIHSSVKPYGYNPLIEYVGHGIGERLHEEPAIPGAYGKPGDGIMLKPGMTIAIETLINMGQPKVIVSKKDGWTTHTADGSMFALFEDTVLITENGRKILTRP
ncbi:MAG: type I methionyl aminopeptidase [bacterium]